MEPSSSPRHSPPKDARETKQRPALVILVKAAIARYPADLRATLELDIDEARRLLTRRFERIVLRRDEDGRLWAKVRGNLSGILRLDDGVLAGVGAGRGILFERQAQIRMA